MACRELRRAFASTLAVLTLLLTLPAPVLARPPNIVVILVDDLRWDEIGAATYPYLRTPHIDRLASEGARFSNAFVTTPLCSPSRASFLTGKYAHTHGIIDNTDRSAASHELTTFPRLLQGAGYETAFIGKWHMGNDDSPRPGFDYWVSFKGQGRYLDPELTEDGRTTTARGYITDILNARATEFIRRPRQKPFVLYLSHKAVHPNVRQRDDGSLEPIDGELFVPAERHRGLYANVTIPRPASYGKPPVGKPALLRRIGDLPPLGPATVTDDPTILGRQRALAAVDDGVGSILQALEASGQSKNTIIVFAGDNGYFYGEHGLSEERRLAYEESARIPLVIWFPKQIRAKSVPDGFALNIDVAPTLLELAGAPIPADIEGRSLMPLLRGTARDWRTSFLIEYYSDSVFPRILNMGYQSVRTERWKYIHYTELDDMDELYDLAADPGEMNNAIGDPARAADLRTLKEELRRLLQPGTTVPAVESTR